MKFEHVTIDDLDHFKATRKEGMRPHVEREGLEWNEEYEDAYHNKMFLSGMKYRTLYKVLEEDKVVGYVGVAPTITIGMWLCEEFRGQGYGTQLFEDLFEQNKGIRFELDVFKESPAKRLYERLGFRVFAESGDFYYMERPR